MPVSVCECVCVCVCVIQVCLEQRSQGKVTLTLADLVASVCAATHRLIRAQFTWFRNRPEYRVSSSYTHTHKHTVHALAQHTSECSTPARILRMCVAPVVSIAMQHECVCCVCVCVYVCVCVCVCVQWLDMESMSGPEEAAKVILDSFAQPLHKGENTHTQHTHTHRAPTHLRCMHAGTHVHLHVSVLPVCLHLTVSTIPTPMSCLRRSFTQTYCSHVLQMT